MNKESPRPTKDYFPTIKELVFLRQYPDEGLASEQLMAKRFNGVCPKCHRNTGYFTPQTRRENAFVHSTCGIGVHPRGGTIFAMSKTPLLTWYEVIFQILVTDGQISPKQVAKIINVYPATANTLMTKIKDYLGMVEGERTFTKSQITDQD